MTSLRNPPMNVIQRSHKAVSAEAFSERRQKNSDASSASARMRNDFYLGGRVAAYAAYPARCALGQGSAEPFIRERTGDHEGCAGHIHWLTLGPVFVLAALAHPVARAMARRAVAREWDVNPAYRADVAARAEFVEEIAPYRTDCYMDKFLTPMLLPVEGVAMLAGALSLLLQGIFIVTLGAGAVLLGRLNAGAAACLRGLRHTPTYDAAAAT